MGKLSARLPNGWLLVDAEYTAVPDAVYPFPSDVVRQLQREDPTFVPLWLRRVYLTPSGGTVVKGYNVLAREITNWDPLIPERQEHWNEDEKDFERCQASLAPLKDFKPEDTFERAELAAVPYGFKHRASCIYVDSILERPRRGRPSDFDPMTMNLVRQLREAAWKVRQLKRKQEAKRAAHAPIERREAAIDTVVANQKQALRDERRDIIGNMRAGQWFAPPEERTKKPFRDSIQKEFTA